MLQVYAYKTCDPFARKGYVRPTSISYLGKYDCIDTARTYTNAVQCDIWTKRVS